MLSHIRDKEHFHYLLLTQIIYHSGPGKFAIMRRASGLISGYKVEEYNLSANLHCLL